MKRTVAAALGAALLAACAAEAAQADTIADVEGARAKERAGYHLSRQDREMLRRYGGNDSYGWRGYRDRYYDDYDAYGGPGVGVYVGPRGAGVYGY